METIKIADNTVSANSPEGQSASMSLQDFLHACSPPRPDTGAVALPDGVKHIFTRNGIQLWFHQLPPNIYSLKWIADGSPMPYGPKASYRTVRIALPYVVTVAVFTKDGTLTQSNECFFTTRPLQTWDDSLFFPALLNISRVENYEVGHPQVPLAWVCTQNLDFRQLGKVADLALRMRKGLAMLLSCLFDTGFNLSSEHHEGNSWFGMSKERDKRIATVDAWQAATHKDPLFALDVDWYPTKLSVKGVAEHIFGRLAQGSSDGVKSAGDLARIVFNHQK